MEFLERQTSFTGAKIVAVNIEFSKVLLPIFSFSFFTFISSQYVQLIFSNVKRRIRNLTDTTVYSVQYTRYKFNVYPPRFSVLSERKYIYTIHLHSFPIFWSQTRASRFLWKSYRRWKNFFIRHKSYVNIIYIIYISSLTQRNFEFSFTVPVYNSDIRNS